VSYWTLTRHTEHTARKEHTCSGCHHTILPGQTYTRLEGLYDGEWTTWKDCGRCVPWHEDVAGAYVRPIDVLEELDENYGDPHRRPKNSAWDGATLTIYGLELVGHKLREVIYQASMVPGVGLTGWVKVARFNRDHYLPGEVTYEELTEVTRE